jgi:deazaflavin-dependent oxidoreductase (nitroreductase family)
LGVLRDVTAGADLAPVPFGYLTTTGRITGNAHRIEIWFAMQQDTVYLLAGGREASDWVRNILVTPEVVFEIGDARRLTRARVLEAGSDEDAIARRLLLEKYGGAGEDLRSWARTSLPVAIAWSMSGAERGDG